MTDKKEHKHKKAKTEHKHKKSKKEHKHKKAKKEKGNHDETKVNKINMVKLELGKASPIVDSTADHNLSKGVSVRDSNNTNTNTQQQSTPLPAAQQKQRPKTKGYVSASDSDSTDNENRSPPRRSILSKPAAKNNTNSPSKSIASQATKRPVSDSDSDSTDNETQQRSNPLPTKRPEPPSLNKSNSKKPATKRSEPTSVKKSIPTTKPAAKKYVSDSDSDSTDNDIRAPPPPPRRSILHKPVSATNTAPPSNRAAKPAKSTTKRPLSDSDSDSTDNEARRPSKPVSERIRIPTNKNVSSAPKTATYINDSSDDDDDDGDEDDTHTKQQQHKSNPDDVASRLANDDSNSGSSDSDNDGELVEVKYKTRKLIERNAKLGEFSQNRLQRIQMYRKRDQTDATEYKRRYVDEADKYQVHHDFFISDSDSASDSNDDYSAEPLPWHARVFNGSQWKMKLEAHTDWKVKTGKFSRLEDIRLEKRIKKICRREGLDLEDFRLKIAENVAENKLLWQKIAKVLPDRPLNLIVIVCRTRYNEHAYQNKPWTEDMDRQLIEYVKIHGTDYNKLESLMDRPRKELQRHVSELLRPESLPKRKVEPWTEEQSQELYKLVETAKSKSNWTNWKNFAKTHYNDKRSGYQCRIKWYSRNANNPLTTPTKLAIIKLLAKQNHQKETELDMPLVSDELGYPEKVIKTFYLKTRSTIPDFEKKNVPDILAILDKRFTEMERSLED